MSPKLSGLLKNVYERDAVAPVVKEFESNFDPEHRRNRALRETSWQEIAKTYYDLVTDFYEYGWGRSFHFAPRASGESFAASIARHEHYIAHRLDLQPGMRVADLGCGVGGPLREIVRFAGANIVGININSYQIERARQFTNEAGLGHLAEYLECDFMSVGAPDDSFDAVYAIEATIHASDRVGVFGEALRLLKPGGHFAAYEYCLTDRFDTQDLHHVQLKNDIELGGGLPDLVYEHEIDTALCEAGFELQEHRDLAISTGPSIPWYEPLVGSGLSLARIRSSRTGRWATHRTLRALETLKIVPQGTLQVSRLLNLCGNAMAEAGRLGIFTPMYFVLGRKPV